MRRKLESKPIVGRKNRARGCNNNNNNFGPLIYLLRGGMCAAKTRGEQCGRQPLHQGHPPDPHSGHPAQSTRRSCCRPRSRRPLSAMRGGLCLCV